MALIALITDTHHGVRNDNKIFHAHLKKFYDNVFFPTLGKYGVKHVIHLGDLVDRRKYINYVTFRKMKNDFIIPLMDSGIHCTYLVGNHDVYYKNTNAQNALNEVFGHEDIPMFHRADMFDVVINPKEVMYDGLNILLLPWITESNYEDSINLIENSKATVALGHLELQGFDVGGRITDHGLSPGLFSKFALVGSGHFHKKQNKDNIFYLGAPYQQTWGDYGNDLGFHLFDTETLELTFIKNPYTIYHKLFWDDTLYSYEEIESLEDDNVKDCYIKIFIENKTNTAMLELLIGRLEELGAADVVVIDQRLSLEETGVITPEEAEDTPTMIKNYIFSIKVPNPDPLNLYMQTLYNEAVNSE